ncbi:MAG: hypothetical protein KME05_01780 [Gloeocapsa sp. UFS-A4-WI-NPMV-4B04]|jgi:hypothetical protein|nr:hypothetical protein [Gloeocapsa sp. UFS-A4-WI-NPMV-4B04]
MDSSYISTLFDLIASPYGLLGIVMLLLILERAKKSPRLAWLLFSVCCFAASLGKYEDEWIKQPPPLVFPLEQLRETGRPLTIILLTLLLLLGLQTRNGWRRLLIPQPIQYLIMVQAAIFLKTAIYGDIGFALQAALTFGAVVQMVRLGPARWLQDGYNFYLGVWAIAMVGVIFTFANAYQGVFNMQALAFVQGRFQGTTANAQHAAVLLAGTIPCFMFIIESHKKWNLFKVFWIANLCLVSYFLFLTGSRTGAIMGVASILFFYRQKVGTLIRLGLFAGIVLSLFLPFLAPDLLTSASVNNRYLSGGNTREGAWTGMWNSFISYPLFGAPLEGGRLGFGENSWLAAGSTTGLMGFIPLVMMGLGCLRIMFQLNSLSNRKPGYFLHTSTIISGLACFISGSFTEAVFLGNLTFPVMALLMYLSLGKYLIDVDYVESQTLL